MLGSIGGDTGGTAADGTVAGIALAGKMAAGCLIAALRIVANGPAVLVRNAFFEHHLLIYGFFVFLVRQVSLSVHLAENIQLAIAVSGRAVPLLTLVHIDALGIGVKQRGVIGNADQAGTFRWGQALQLLAVILRCCTFHAIAAPTQINLI